MFFQVDDSNDDQTKHVEDDFDETQLFVKSYDRNVEISHEEDEIFHVATQQIEQQEYVFFI